MARRKSLARSATGLARYYLDCGFWRTKKFRSLPLDALGLWTCLVGAANEQATDGALPADPEDLAAAVGLRLSAVKKPLQKLKNASLIEQIGDEIFIVGFTDHNPTSAEVEDFIEERSRQGSRGNHVRWHQNKQRWDRECAYCTAVSPDAPAGWDDVTDPDSNPKPDRQSDRYSDPDSDPPAIANASHGMGWDGMGWDNQVVSPTGLGEYPQAVDNDDDDDRKNSTKNSTTLPDPTRTLATATAKARSTRLGGGHSPAWIVAVADDIMATPSFRHLSTTALTPAEIDLALDGLPLTPTPTGKPNPATITKPPCNTCDNTGWIDQGNHVTRCPTCDPIGAAR